MIGPCCSTIFGLFLVWWGVTKVEIERETFHFDWQLSKKIIACGFAFWIAQMAMGFISLVYNGQLGNMGAILPSVFMQSSPAS
ncbi:MAG: hypothetical protein Q4A55_06875 [Aerococcus sp.]|nr:hypothetical protein [Aerococcus sp.]